jgi:hypothetical protein
MNHTVAIPSSFFLNEAKHEYYDYRTRLVQELLQNSLDAGATVIRLTFDALGYKCEDNGRGMTQDRMVNALLTMGGSVKEAGATGGFGAAKKLLLFAHASFAIHSNDTLVCGNGLSYRFHGCLARKGTEIGAVWANAADFDNMQWKATELLKKCNFSGHARVYVNGVLFTDYVAARHSHNVEGVGEVFANKNRTEGENSVLVLHNGLFMFDHYISDLNRKVVVMVSGPSTTVFTQNRDGFKSEVRQKFAAFIAKITVDKKSVVKPKARKFIIEGMDTFVAFISKTFTITPAIQAAINQVRMNPGSFTATEIAQAVVAKIEANANASTQDKATAESIATFVKNGGANLQTDFHFDLADSSYRKVPGKYVPNTGKPKFTALAKTWKVAVRNVLQANGLDQNFVIGFTFRSEATATHQMRDGVSCYLINPESTEIDEGTKQEKTMKVLTTAVHEVVHSQGCGCHDEEFVGMFHKLLVPTLTKGLTWRQIVKAAKTEKV